MKYTRATIAGVGAAVIGLFSTSLLLGHLTAEAAPADTSVSQLKQEPEDAPTWARSSFPENSAGQTYGSDADAKTLADGPDLVAVVGDSGVLGFVYNKELNRSHFATFEEAQDWEADRSAGKLVTLQVYDLDGKTVVDTFTLDNGIVEETTD